MASKNGHCACVPYYLKVFGTIEQAQQAAGFKADPRSHKT